VSAKTATAANVASASTPATTAAPPAPAAAPAPATTVASDNKGGFFSNLLGHKDAKPAAATVPPARAAAPAAAPKPDAPPPPAPAFTGLEYVAQAPVGLEDARRNALKAHPGSVTNSLLGPDKQGRLRYVFTISGAQVYVDAQDGKILAKDP
jgi:uncharacterized membrane protein YkoI